jgi:hypothetical protein
MITVTEKGAIVQVVEDEDYYLTLEELELLEAELSHAIGELRKSAGLTCHSYDVQRSKLDPETCTCGKHEQPPATCPHCGAGI